MGRADYLKLGDWNGVCDVCGRKFKASKLKLRWDGLRVCPDDFEFRHSQDFVKGIKDDQSVPYSRPESTDQFIPINYTEQSSDSLSVSDTSSLGVLKYVPALPPVGLKSTVNSNPLNTQALNGSYFVPQVAIFPQNPLGQVLNAFQLNYNPVNYTPTNTQPETMLFVEQYLIERGRVLADSVAASEAITVVWGTSNQVNRFTLNSYTLG